MSTKDYFEYGPTVSIDQLTKDEAVLLFGRPLYEAWRNTLGISLDIETALRVKSVDRAKRCITVEFAETKHCK